MFGDGAQLLIDFIEQCGDKLHGHHTALLSSQGCHAAQRGRVVGELQAQKLILVLTVLRMLNGLQETNTIGYYGGREQVTGYEL